MFRLFILTISILSSSLTLAKSNYQVDLILFAHPQSAGKASDLGLNSPLMPISKNAITLVANSSKAYGLLPPSKSQLRDEYYLLSRKSRNRVLGHYSWIQPANNESKIALPGSSSNGWVIQGTVRVRQGTYYVFDTDIQLSPPSNPQSSFTVVQKQRLKDNLVYFLDHPQIGMIVKIHKLA